VPVKRRPAVAPAAAKVDEIVLTTDDLDDVLVVDDLEVVEDDAVELDDVEVIDDESA
jgi:hypothetical protein